MHTDLHKSSPNKSKVLSITLSCNVLTGPVMFYNNNNDVARS